MHLVELSERALKQIVLPAEGQFLRPLRTRPHLLQGNREGGRRFCERRTCGSRTAFAKHSTIRYSQFASEWFYTFAFHDSLGTYEEREVELDLHKVPFTPCPNVTFILEASARFNGVARIQALLDLLPPRRYVANGQSNHARAFNRL